MKESFTLTYESRKLFCILCILFSVKHFVTFLIERSHIYNIYTPTSMINRSRGARTVKTQKGQLRVIKVKSLTKVRNLINKLMKM